MIHASSGFISYQTDGVLINLIPGLGESIVSGKEEAFTIEYTGSKPTYYFENEIYNEIYFNKDIKKAPDIKTGASKAISFLLPAPFPAGESRQAVILYSEKDSHPATHLYHP